MGIANPFATMVAKEKRKDVAIRGQVLRHRGFSQRLVT